MFVHQLQQVWEIQADSISEELKTNRENEESPTPTGLSNRANVESLTPTGLSPDSPSAMPQCPSIYPDEDHESFIKNNEDYMFYHSSSIMLVQLRHTMAERMPRLVEVCTATRLGIRSVIVCRTAPALETINVACTALCDLKCCI